MPCRICEEEVPVLDPKEWYTCEECQDAYNEAMDISEENQRDIAQDKGPPYEPLDVRTAEYDVPFG